MTIPINIRDFLISLKATHSNRLIGQMFKRPCTPQAVGGWILHSDSKISYENVMDIKSWDSYKKYNQKVVEEIPGGLLNSYKNAQEVKDNLQLSCSLESLVSTAINIGLAAILKGRS